jgi:hypothetical protein
VLPDTDTQFSLDLEVVATLDHPVVYVVEQRARPAYRILAFDPSTGVAETVLSVPEDAIIYGISLRNDRDTLAIAYAPDYREAGSGVWTIDLTAGLPVDPADMELVVDVQPDVYLTEPDWSTDDTTVFVTHVDRRTEEEQLSVSAVAMVAGDVSTVAHDAIGPVAAGDAVFFLDVDEAQARRSVGVVDGDARRSSIAVGNGSFDLDYLIGGDAVDELHVSVIEGTTATTAASLTFGQSVSAHGNHEVPSVWWGVAVESSGGTTVADSTATAPIGLDAVVVYDATFSGEAIVYATREGLSFGFSVDGTADKVDVIASRAIRFVAA